MKPIEVAIVYDRVNKWGGAERVLLALHELFPKAPLYTSVYDKNSAPWAKIFPKVYTSFLQKIPFAKKNHEFLGTLMPLAFESFNFDRYDLVISVTSEAAKGIITKAKTVHICYCLTPTRYLWSGKDFYFNNLPNKFRFVPFFKHLAKPFLFYLHHWDRIAARRPDVVIAISNEVKKRIKKYYGRSSVVIYPPVSLVGDGKEPKKKKNYYLVHGRFEPYKRLDLVVGVFNKLGYPLIVSGSGSEMKRQRALARPNIKFIFNPTDKKLTSLYKSAKAFIMPQEEDFGIVAVEAQSFGVPVIALGSGGAKDTVLDGVTGVFFNKQDKESLASAIAKFEKIVFNHRYLIKNARKFSKEIFRRNIVKLVKNI